ncbi:MAG: isopentenyl-diphosphate Delta-isomerase [Sediminibacterium sp.]|nr:isopentenyl-diphosphate Delta-isomerase [Sediminibacterium sp.]
MKTNEYLIIVDCNDNEQGKLEKILTHELGVLHRAFSVFIFNSKGELLLQQRSEDKYHSGGLWTNTCCSHPQYGEEVNDAVKRRLKEEMGLECSTNFAFKFQYKSAVNNGLIENEIDYVYLGISDYVPIPNYHEVQDWKYSNLDFLAKDLDMNAQNYTQWFKICFEKIRQYYYTYFEKNVLPCETINLQNI